jgi:hypothetical protein
MIPQDPGAVENLASVLKQRARSLVPADILFLSKKMGGLAVSDGGTMSEPAYLDTHVRWRHHKNQAILSVHFRDLTEEQMFEVLEHHASTIRATPGKLRVLIDLSGAAITTPFFNRVKVLGKEVFEVKSERRAMVGISGLKQIFVQGYIRVTGASKTIQVFNDEQSALDWLAS